MNWLWFIRCFWLTLLTTISVSSKCLPNIFGASPGNGSILMHTSSPFLALSTSLLLCWIPEHIPSWQNYSIKIFLNSMKGERLLLWCLIIRPMYTEIILTDFEGTQRGVPGLTIPASTTTPATIGSRDLNMQLGNMRSLHGKTATFLNWSLFFCLSSSW